MQDDLPRHVERLLHPDPQVRNEAIRSLGQVADNEASWKEISAASQALEVPRERLCESLHSALDDEAEEIRAGAIRLLATFSVDPLTARPAERSSAAFFAIAGCLRDPAEHVRRAAVFAVAALDPEGTRSSPMLLRALDDPSDVVRLSAAASAPPDFGHAMPIGVKGLGDRSPVVRAQAVHTLAAAASRAGQPMPPRDLAEPWNAAEEALRKALADPSERVRFGAAITLLKFSPNAPDARPVLEDMLADEEPGVRLEGALTLLELDPAHPRGGEVVAHALEEGGLEDVFRLLLRLAVISCRHPRVVGRLRELLDVEDFRFRVRTAAALTRARTEDPEAVRILREGAASKDLYARVEAVHGLGAAPARDDVLSTLAAALEDDSWMVRIGATAALGELGPAARGAIAALRRRLEDDEEVVRRMAVEALVALEAGPSDGP